MSAFSAADNAFPVSAGRAPRARRRELLQAGAMGLGGLTLSGLLRGQAAAGRVSRPRPPHFGRAKSCLLLFLSGGMSHHDTFDMKPEAPAAIRGEFRPIDTNVPGIQVCEHLPLVSQVADKFTTIRSLSHRDNNHASAVYWMLTGNEYPRASGLSENLSREDHPHLGSALTLVDRAADRPVPVFVTLPDYIAVNGPIRAGQHAGFLGSRVDPLVARGNPNDDDFRPTDLGIVPNVAAPRMASRRELLGTLDGPGAPLDRVPQMSQLDSYYSKAFDVLSSGVTRRAFDIQAEPAALRDAYGRHQFGQSVLLGRRLVEAGVRLVHVNWIRIREPGWDTHADNFNSLRQKLLPPADKAFSALMNDLSGSGLLDETLVIMLGEFGRSPKITESNAGREHWGPVNSIQIAGAGIPGGRLFGATDKDGAYPVENRISPADLIATIYHALGIDHETVVTTQLQRPFTLAEGRPVLELWG